MSRIRTLISRNAVLAYYLLTFAISWGLVLAVIVVSGGLPGTLEHLNAQLPVAIVAMLGGPSIAALIVTGLADGREGFRALWVRMQAWRVGLQWYAVALLVGPLVSAGGLLMLARFSPGYLPGIVSSEHKLADLIMGVVPAITVGICEELGWTGVATPRLRQRHGAFVTALIVGVLWGAWHLLSNGIWPSRAIHGEMGTLPFLVLYLLSFLIGQLPAFRVLMLWVYEETGSLPLIMLMHASLTASALVLGPAAAEGAQLLIVELVRVLAMWAVVGAVALIRRGRLSRTPLEHSVA